MEKETTYDVYLCCANQEKDIQNAKQINDYLTYQGYRVFFSSMDIDLEAMESSSSMLLYASDGESLQEGKLLKKWGKYMEWIMEGKRQSNSFCLLLQGMNASSLPIPLKTYAYISWESRDAAAQLGFFLKGIR